jgi:glutamyl-tRNA synthetase
MNAPVRVRFAPSPTGFLHVGGARTALFNWLYARHTGGKFILRVEDTDKSRNTEEAVQVIYDGLKWLGLDWDEGPNKGGDFGPYQQSERNDLYEKHLAKLMDSGVAYLDEKGATRFRLPRKVIVMEDLVCGRVEVDRSKPINPLGDLEPDMTIRRPDGSWIFHFVNVVDDIEMGITHVIRGEDHLSNTPKHLELYAALGATPPRFAHIPLILNRDGSKMSKRDAGASVQGYMHEGYAPEAVANYLCLLGWSPKDNREKLPMEEIISLFELEKINRRNAAFDSDKCFWLNGQYIAAMSLERFRELALPWLKEAGLSPGRSGCGYVFSSTVEFPDGGFTASAESFSDDYLLQVLASIKEKIKLFKDVPAWTTYFFAGEVAFDEEAVRKTLRAPGAGDRLTELAERLESLPDTDWTHDGLEAAFKALAAEKGIKTAAFIHPARVAASGRAVGPSLYHLLAILGKARVLTRLRDTAAMVTAGA